MKINEYVPSTRDWVADQVALYESSGGKEGTTLRGLPVIIVTNAGCKTGHIRKTPLMKAVDGPNYILVASRGGAPKHPMWYYNIKANSSVEIRDGIHVHKMQAREINDLEERERLWAIAIKAYPLYKDYREKTDRVIPIFLAEAPPQYS